MGRQIDGGGGGGVSSGKLIGSRKSTHHRKRHQPSRNRVRAPARAAAAIVARVVWVARRAVDGVVVGDVQPQLVHRRLAQADGAGVEPLLHAEGSRVVGAREVEPAAQRARVPGQVLFVFDGLGRGVSWAGWRTRQSCSDGCKTPTMTTPSSTLLGLPRRQRSALSSAARRTLSARTQRNAVACRPPSSRRTSGNSASTTSTGVTAPLRYASWYSRHERSTLRSPSPCPRLDDGGALASQSTAFSLARYSPSRRAVAAPRSLGARMTVGT